MTKDPEVGANRASAHASSVYYFEIGRGDWTGTFSFKVTSWRAFWNDSISLVNRFLALSMAFTTVLLGKGYIVSRLEAYPERGDAGVATNDVRITKLGLTIYRLQEEYVLNPDGRQVEVRSRERFGPIPFLFNVRKQHPAEILDAGMRAIYYIPLLGSDWVANYTVRSDRDHIDSVMTCPWGEAQEVIDRAQS